MDGATVAWAALGLTIIVQAGAAGIYIGTTAGKLSELKHRFDRHEKLRADKAHGHGIVK